MGLLEIGLGVAALYGGGRVLGVIPAPSSAAAPGTAPVPAGQTAAPGAVAAAVPGHVFPVAPDPVQSANYKSFLDRIDGIAKSAGYSAGAGYIPRVGSDGRWYDGFGQLYQFRDCQMNPTGQPGYMSLEYRRFLDGGINCDGTPMVKANATASGGLSPEAQTAIQVGTTAAVAAGSAAAGGSGAAAAVAAGAASALAALGPVPPTEGADGWSRHEVRTLRKTEGDRTLGVNVFGTPWGDYLVAAVEVPAEVAALMLWAPAPGLERAYEDHAHRVVGRFDSLHEASAAAVNFAREWSEDRRRVGAPCPCPELRPSEPAIAVPS